jgi:hypothetical protein
MTWFSSIVGGGFRWLSLHVKAAKLLRAPHDIAAIQRWKKNGRQGSPPHALKRMVVQRLARRFAARILIETGTFHGDMISAVSEDFQQLVSIELDGSLASKARRRLRHFGHIEVIQGDSALLLPEVISKIAQPCIFWLDGHYSGQGTARGLTETPILSELPAVLSHKVKDHVILIDDARCFDGSAGYPSLSDLRNLLERHGNEYSLTVHQDIIRIVPRGRTPHRRPVLEYA